MSENKKEFMQLEKWYKPHEAAEIMGVSTRTIFRYLQPDHQPKQLKGYQVGNRWRITESAIREFLGNEA